MTEQPSERRIVLLLFRSHRADDEAARVGCRAQEILEPFNRVGIRPLQVVDDEDERRRRSECLRQRLEKAQALPALELPVGDGNVGARGDHLRTKPCDVGQPATHPVVISAGCSASLFSQAAIGAYARRPSPA